MPELPQELQIQPQSVWPHVAVIAIGALLAVVLIILILYLRPQYDPVMLIGYVGGAMALATTQIIAIIKSSQHDQQSREIGASVVYRVDGAMDKLLNARAAQENAQGQITGAEQERLRVAEMKAAANVRGDRRSVPAAPVPVRIVGDTTVPVVVLEDKKSN